MHWPELHSLFSSKSDSTNENRRQNVIHNPHIVDWFFDQHAKSFIKGELRGKNEAILHDWPIFSTSIFDNNYC